ILTICYIVSSLFFSFNHTSTTAFYTLSLHDALPIYLNILYQQQLLDLIRQNALGNFGDLLRDVSKSASMLNFLNNNQNRKGHPRSEEHTSELQSPCNLVCRLLLEKKKQELTWFCRTSASPHCQSRIPPKRLLRYCPTVGSSSSASRRVSL